MPFNNRDIILSLTRKFLAHITLLSFLFIISNLLIFIILLIPFISNLLTRFHIIKLFLLEILDHLFNLLVIIQFNLFFIRVAVLCLIIFFIHGMLHHFFIRIVIEAGPSHSLQRAVYSSYLLSYFILSL